MRKKKEKRGVGCCFSIEKKGCGTTNPRRTTHLASVWHPFCLKTGCDHRAVVTIYSERLTLICPTLKNIFFFSLCLTFPKRITSVIFVCVCVCVSLGFFFFLFFHVFHSRLAILRLHQQSHAHTFFMYPQSLLCVMCAFRRPKRKWEKHLDTFEVFF